jgi:hypothetical protein
MKFFFFFTVRNGQGKEKMTIDMHQATREFWENNGGSATATPGERPQARHPELQCPPEWREMKFLFYGHH